VSEKQQAAKEIASLVASFCDKHLNDELRACALKLCDTLSRKRKLNICRGRKEIWAAAIIYVIARLNFLFDKARPCFLSVDTICDFFGTKKSTTSNKANLIEEACDLGLGEPDYCTEEINKAFSFFQLPNGLIVPEHMVETIAFEVADEEESKAIAAYLAEQRRLEEEAIAARKQRRTEINRKSTETKKQKKKFRQPGLFDD
jgi:hypothetical protein